MNDTSRSDGTPQNDTDDIIDAEVVHEEPASEQTKSDPSAPVTKAQENKKAGKSGWVVAGILASFLAGVYATPYFQHGMVALGLRTPAVPQQASNGGMADLDAFKKELDDLRATTTALRAAAAQNLEELDARKSAQEKLRADLDMLAAQAVGSPNGSPKADLAEFRSEMERLSVDVARLSALSSEKGPALSQINGALALARAENAQLQERLTVLEAALKALEAGSLEASPRGRLVLSLGRMKDKAMAGEAYGADLEGLRADLAKLPAIDQQLMGAELAVLAQGKDGIVPYVKLVRDYDPAVSAAIRSGEKAEGGFLQNLFTVRRTDTGAAGDDAVFLKAERRLLARDVSGAIEALSALEGPVAEAMEPWVSAARLHANSAAAFDRLIQAASNGEG